MPDSADPERTRAAANHFNYRSAQHSRYAVVHVRNRIFNLGLFVGVIFLLVLVFAFDSTRVNAARKYASAIKLQWKEAASCDNALGRRRFWFFGTVASTDLCVNHIPRASYYTQNEPGTRFLIVGDWGRDGMCCQHDVAVEMANAAVLSKPRASFIVSTGDNFYNDGVMHAYDDQINRSWRDVYIRNHKPLQLPWKIILGNHDYQGNVSAQKELSNIDKYWHMPQYYYFETIGTGRNEIFMSFIDTSPMYYNESQFSIFGNQFSIPYRDTQLDALQKALAESKAPWKIVFGHHPIMSSGESFEGEKFHADRLKAHLLPILKKHKVAAYFCGHDHLIEHLLVEGIHLFVSGAGSKLSRIFANHKETAFVLDRQGFINAVVRDDMDLMTVRMTDYFGSVVHEANVTRPR